MYDTLLEFAGRLHPVLLHVPIGALAALVFLELVWLLHRTPLPREVRVALCVLLVLTSASTAGSGWLLAGRGGYAGQTLFLHRWIGIGFAAGVWVPTIAAIGREPRVYAWSLGASLAMCAVGGHLGGTITHGRGFLTEPFFPRQQQDRHEPTLDPIVAPPSEVGMSFTRDVAPIFDRVCVSCHGPDKQKGGLTMDTPEGLLLGGDTGDAFVPGDADASEIAFRMRLPIDDEDHMPPEEKPQPTEAEIDAIVRWIEDGARFE